MKRQERPAEQVHVESLEDEATHATDEARMVLPGVQAILGFQLIAAFNQRFVEFDADRQVLHLIAFLLVAVATGLLMTPAAYHRQAGRGRVTRRFVDLASTLLALALVPLLLGLVIDSYLIAWLILRRDGASLGLAAGLGVVLAALWFAMPQIAKRAAQRPGGRGK